MGFSPRIYEIHLWLQDEEGDWWWEAHGGGYKTFQEAFKWYEAYKAGGHDVRVVETKCVRAWEDGKEWI